jgi:hypothetical protein
MNLDIFYDLITPELPRGDAKDSMFAMHNSLVGRSAWIRKAENPKTVCGACVQKVKVNLWKWYHFESTKKLDDLEFTGRLGVSKQPIYLKK